MYDRPFKYGIKDHTSVQNFFRPLVTAEEVCKGVNLEGKVVVVTGANSGLGKCLVTACNIASPQISHRLPDVTGLGQAGGTGHTCLQKCCQG